MKIALPALAWTSVWYEAKITAQRKMQRMLQINWNSLTIHSDLQKPTRSFVSRIPTNSTSLREKWKLKRLQIYLGVSYFRTVAANISRPKIWNLNSSIIIWLFSAMKIQNEQLNLIKMAREYSTHKEHKTKIAIDLNTKTSHHQMWKIKIGPPPPVEKHQLTHEIRAQTWCRIKWKNTHSWPSDTTRENIY